MTPGRFHFTPRKRVNSRLSRREALGYSGAALAGVIAGGAPGSITARQSAVTPVATSHSGWEQLDQLLKEIAPTTALLAAELVSGEIQPIHEFNADQVLPVGSSFKLWILGALAIQVEDGTLDWGQLVEIQDQYRSVPGGDLRYVDAGTEFTLRYLAERMIQKSDNTATDHLLFLVGRENVQEAMIAMGVSDPDRNIPLISTRELVMLKFAYTAEQRDAYYAASVEERYRILTEEVDALPYEALTDIDQIAPIDIDRVEWFASREDLARTMEWLLVQSQQPGMRPVAEILSLETPLPFDGETWPYLGYKGGSEMGVLSATWLLRRADGRYFVYTVGFRDPEAAIDMDAAVAAMEAGRDILALTP